MVVNPVGLDDERWINNKITVYPNPSENFIFVSLTDKSIIGGRIDIINFQGQLVHKQPIEFEQQIIKIDHLPAGIYLMRIIGTGGTNYFEKFTKF